MVARSVAHLTSAHSRDDVRIFRKECRTLAKNGYRVLLIVADGLGNAAIDGVEIIDVGKRKGRLSRMIVSTFGVLRKAFKLDVAIYHIHDPELIPAGLMLRLKGKHVIFDAHEDVPKQLRSKPYLGPLRLALLAASFSVFEKLACKYMSGIVGATSTIHDKFKKINPRTVAINNYPLIGELESSLSWGEKDRKICYVGGITLIRGIVEAVSAMEFVRTNVVLSLVGAFAEPEIEAKCMRMKGWQKIDAHGFLGRDEVRVIMSQSLAGLVAFHPFPNHIDAQPNKMFEYMSAGIPVIASNFPLWSEIIEGNQCGICVDPMNPEEIARAIDFLVENPAQAENMGKNGQRAVRGRYNWEVEEKNLLNFYREIESA